MTTTLIAAAVLIAAALFFLARAQQKDTVARYETFRASRSPTRLVITARPTEITPRPTEISTALPFTPGVTGRELALADGTVPGPEHRTTALSNMLASFP